MKPKIYLLVVLSGMLFWQCSKEDDIVAELGTYSRSYDTTSTNPADKFTAQYFYRYNRVFITDPDTADYLYNFQNRNTLRMSMRDQSTEARMYGIGLMRELFLDFYPDTFIRKHFPFSLMIADTLVSSVGLTPKDVNFYNARNFLALNVGPRTKKYTAAEKSQLSAGIHISFLVNNLYTYDSGWELEEFFTSGKGKYGLSAGTADKPKKWAIAKIYEAGFLYDYDDGWPAKNTKFPTQQQDLNDWLEFILGYRVKYSKVPTNVEELLATYPSLKSKYDALTKSIKECVGVDYKELIYKVK